MDTAALKKFAPAARTLLREQVSARLNQVLAEGSAARREAPNGVRELEGEITRTSRDQVVERVAYTWFNRFTALRFMDANGYTGTRVVSPAEGQTRPEILAEAAAGVIGDEVPEDVAAQVRALLDNRTPSRDPQGEAYRLLLVAICNHWHGVMPFMFEKIADCTELLMPDDLLSANSLLARLRTVMTEDACQDVEIIGWLYQFYISEKKDEVFAGLKKNVKITAENIPAATQLFTPHWIVRYLVENSLGRLWLLNRPQSKLAERMEYYIAPEQPETNFLRIARPEEIRICDPACGSGHMLTYAFELLYVIYEEEGYDAVEIPGLILAHNLFGIEIDDRAGALAAFALAMKGAAKLGRRRFQRLGVQPNICVMQDVSFTPAEMQNVATVVGRDLFTGKLRDELLQFGQAKNYGSLIVPKLLDPAETLRVVKARDFGGDLLLKEVQERVLTVLRTAEALSPKYQIVVANPPYAGAKGLNAELQAYIKKSFPNSKSDLFAAFMERGLMLTVPKACSAMVTMESWMFLTSYEKLRDTLLDSSTFHSMIHMPYLGKGGTSMGISFGTVAFVLEKGRKVGLRGNYICVRYFETNEVGVPLQFPVENERRSKIGVEEFDKIPSRPIAYWVSDSVRSAFNRNEKIGDVCDVCAGHQTGDNDRFLRKWQEVSRSDIFRSASNRIDAEKSEASWFPHSKGGEFRRWFGNSELVVNWKNDGAEIRAHPSSALRNPDKMFIEGVSWSHTTSGSFGARFSPKGTTFNVEGPTLFHSNPYFFLGLLCSNSALKLIQTMSQTLHFLVGTVSKVPTPKLQDVTGDVTSLVKQLVGISRSDWDAYETSWDFNTLPLLFPNHQAGTLKATYARLRAHWKGMTDEMQRLEEENNLIFINAYRLKDELTPGVPIEEITLSCNPAYRYSVKCTEEDREIRLLADTIAEFLSYAVGCMFGRYSLDEPGLILANQGDGMAEYRAKVPNSSFLPDEDNVIPMLDGDWFPDDISERFRQFLRLTFGERHFQENLAFVEAALGKDIKKYFIRDFFNDHVKRYKSRPIYWLFSSPKGTFNALIYMHRYRPDTVSIVLNDYLRQLRNKLEAHRRGQEALSISGDASQGQRTKALKEVDAVGKQIAELDAYERDVLFPLASRRIEIDLDDGVKANYPKFGDALKPIKGLAEADD